MRQGEERRPEVGRDHRVEIRGRDLANRVAQRAGDAGGIDQHVDPLARPIEEAPERRRHGCFVGDVRRQDQRFPAGLGDLGGDLVQQLLAAPDQADIVSGPGQRQRGLATGAAAGPGDQCLRGILACHSQAAGWKNRDLAPACSL